MIATESHMLERPSGEPLNVGDEAPDFAYTLADGTTHQLSDLRGQRVLINFWATWCPPCKAEMPDIQAAYEQYGNDDFMVLAVNSAEEQARVEAFAAEMGLTIPLITNEAGDIGTGYGARGLPTSYFVDRDGTISYRHTGIMTTAFIQQRSEEMQ
jgi:peroxiredoxin